MSVDAVVAHEIAQKTEIRVNRREAAVAPERPLHGAFDGVAVLIERNQASVGSEPFDNGRRMAAATEGDVDIDAVGPDGKRLESLRKKCGYVIGFGQDKERFNSGCKITNFRPKVYT